jgi:2-polyprenyl-6-methoxyphenol hydroxylase-like FAD-dependent oxidoreductase
MESLKGKKVLVSGASMAGLSTAYWMNKLGYTVTLVEMASEPRTAGGAVNIEGTAADDAKRMGILEQLKSQRLNLERIEFKNAADITEGSMSLINEGEELPDDNIEIERDKFIQILMDGLKSDVAFMFNNSITALDETKDEIRATFKNGLQQSYDLVFGCDGAHSGVRRIWFGDESEYTHFLQGYFSITIVNKLLIQENTMQMYNLPDKCIMLNAYNNKTDIIFSFNSEKEIPYHYRDEEQQRNIILEQFEGLGWRTGELLEEVKQSKTFYFDKFCQIKMPSWTKGRVALVGDAAYCPSPAAGKGASLAMNGATALADALQKHKDNFELAFLDYNKDLRPFIEETQATAETNVKKLIPATGEAIHKRNTEDFLNI